MMYAKFSNKHLQFMKIPKLKTCLLCNAVLYQVLLNYERAHQLYVYGISNLSLSILIKNGADRAVKTVMEILCPIYIVDKYLPM